jgi:hypothetical protein
MHKPNKTLLAYTMIGSYPSISGHLLCPSQQRGGAGKEEEDEVKVLCGQVTHGQRA